MSKEATQELLMGAVMVLLAYAAYRHFKPAPAKAPAQAKMAQPSQGFAAGEPSPSSTYTGSPYTSLTDLLTGTTHDIGEFQGRNYLNEISDPLEPVNPYDGIKLVNRPW